MVVPQLPVGRYCQIFGEGIAQAIPTSNAASEIDYNALRPIHPKIKNGQSTRVKAGL